MGSPVSPEYGAQERQQLAGRAEVRRLAGNDVLDTPGKVCIDPVRASFELHNKCALGQERRRFAGQSVLPGRPTDLTCVTHRRIITSGGGRDLEEILQSF